MGNWMQSLKVPESWIEVKSEGQGDGPMVFGVRRPVLSAWKRCPWAWMPALMALAEGSGLRGARRTQIAQLMDQILYR